MTVNGSLVTTDWVAANADGPAHRLVEVDEDTEAYRQGHIPGAIAWHWRDDLHGHPRRDFLDREGLAGLLARSGVGPDTTVVLYGGNNNWFATYAYWLLRYRGFDRVTLMDGGRTKWELEGRELTAAEPAVAPADPGALGPERPELRAYRDDALGHIGRDGAAMIDVRSPAEYAGEVLAPPHLPQEQAQVPGHIPGAANVPWATAAREDGSFKSRGRARPHLRRGRRDARPRRDRVLPHRRALEPHLVRPPRDPRLPEGAQLRRVVDRVRQPRRRAGGDGAVILRPFLYAPTACASYLFGCTTHGRLAVVNPHAELVNAYLAEAERAGSPIVAVFDTHVQADHVSGMSAIMRETGAAGFLPAGSGASLDHRAMRDLDEVVLGNTVVRAIATPGHSPAHHAYLVADRRRGTDDPWLVFTGDALLVGSAGRPDLHAGEPREAARALHASLGRLLALSDDVVVLPSHYGGSVCGGGVSGNPISTIGFERRHNRMLGHADPDAFADALLDGLPPPPPGQQAIVEANLRGALPTAA